MAGYFFDSSALVKLYHAEAGTSVVDAIVNKAESIVCISRLTLGELTSAFAIKARTGSISIADARALIWRFQEDIAAAKLQVYSLADAQFSAAESLIEKHGLERRLRTLDALQLAVALDLREQRVVETFVTADLALVEVASLEGFSVLNPAKP